jgi:hypothetical protein
MFAGKPFDDYCPGGTADTSPAFQRWENVVNERLVPQGRLKHCDRFQSFLREVTENPARPPAATKNTLQEGADVAEKK